MASCINAEKPLQKIHVDQPHLPTDQASPALLELPCSQSLHSRHFGFQCVNNLSPDLRLHLFAFGACDQIALSVEDNVSVPIGLDEKAAMYAYVVNFVVLYHAP